MNTSPILHCALCKDFKRHQFDRLMDVRLGERVAHQLVMYRCGSCGMERQWGLIDPNANVN